MPSTEHPFERSLVVQGKPRSGIENEHWWITICPLLTLQWE